MNYFAANGEGEVGSAWLLNWPAIKRSYDSTVKKNLLVGVRQRTKCIQRVPERSRENSRSARQGWVAAHWRHWEMASCKQNWLNGSMDRIDADVGRCMKYWCGRCCRTARWRSLTGRRIFSRWRRVNTSPQRRSKWSIISVNQWPRYLFTGTVYRSGIDEASRSDEWENLSGTDPPPTCVFLGVPGWRSRTWPRDFAWVDEEERNWRNPLRTLQKQGQISF